MVGGNGCSAVHKVCTSTESAGAETGRGRVGGLRIGGDNHQERQRTMFYRFITAAYCIRGGAVNFITYSTRANRSFQTRYVIMIVWVDTLIHVEFHSGCIGYYLTMQHQSEDCSSTATLPPSRGTFVFTTQSN